MADINWIGDGTDVNWSTSTNWDGGVVPGIDDTAVLTNTGAGNCTLDADITIGGFKLLTGYAGTFNQNSKVMNVGKDGTGVFHYMRNGTFNAVINLFVNDFFYASNFGSTAHVKFHTSCDLRRYGPTPNSQGQLTNYTIDAGVTVNLRAATHPDYPTTVVSPTFRQNAGTGTNRGVLDLTEATAMSVTYGVGIPIWDFEGGTIRNTSENVIPITSSPARVLVGTVDGPFTLDCMLYTPASNMIRGDFSQFQSVIFNCAGTAAMSLTISNTVFNDFIFTNRIAHASGLNFSSSTPVVVRGDVRVKRYSDLSGPISINPGVVFELSGTADQDIDFAVIEAPVDCSIQKPAGNVTNAVGSDLNVIEDSECGKLINSGNVTVPDGVTLEADIETNSGSSLIFSDTAMLITENITRPDNHSDILEVYHVTVNGSENTTLDLVGNVEPMTVIFDKPVGNSIIIISSTGSEDDVKILTSGKSKGDVYFSGVGTVRLIDDLNVHDLDHDETIFIDENGHTVIGNIGHVFMLETCSIPVDKNGIPIFQKSKYGGTPCFSLLKTSDIRIHDNKPMVFITSGSDIIFSWSSQLPLTQNSSVSMSDSGDIAEIKSYRNTGAVSFPLNDAMQMIVTVDPEEVVVDRYESFMSFAWPLNENNIPIVKVAS